MRNRVYFAKEKEVHFFWEDYKNSYFVFKYSDVSLSPYFLFQILVHKNKKLEKILRVYVRGGRRGSSVL